MNAGDFDARNATDIGIHVAVGFESALDFAKSANGEKIFGGRFGDTCVFLGDKYYFFIAFESTVDAGDGFGSTKLDNGFGVGKNNPMANGD